jgi:predicted lysophospholipase L1 biosynthesis ABC-type transport system permease subunit
MTSKRNYAGLGIALGAGLGAVAGVMAGNMGVWLAIGVAIGLVIGLSSRRKATECPQCEAMHRTHELGSRANSQVG